MDGFSELGDLIIASLNENSVFAQKILHDRKHLEAALLEMFMETRQRVGMVGRMPKCHVQEFGGYCKVEIYAKYRDDAWRLMELMNKYENGEKYPSYILN